MKLLSIARPRLCRRRGSPVQRAVVSIGGDPKKVCVIVRPHHDEPPDPPKAA